MTVRLRLAVIAPLTVLGAFALHLLGARPASAAATRPAKHAAERPRHAKAHHRAPAHEPLSGGRAGHPASAPAVSTTGAHRRRTHHTTHAGGLVLFVRHRGQVARAAADPSASIVDFSFSPSTITIHVGDTITWTNVGKQPHTATADNHSFDTGVLQHGQSGSHTFTTPGTYTYYCIVHPYMRGTVVVLANATTTTTTTTTPTTTTPSTASTASSSSGLPNTGLDIAGVVLCGAALTGLGYTLRRLLANAG